MCAHVLAAPAFRPVLSSSFTPALLVIEALVTNLLESGNDRVSQAEKLTDALSAYLYGNKTYKDANSPDS